MVFYNILVGILLIGWCGSELTKHQNDNTGKMRKIDVRKMRQNQYYLILGNPGLRLNRQMAQEIFTVRGSRRPWLQSVLPFQAVEISGHTLVFSTRAITSRKCASRHRRCHSPA
jgi:hypothetical protein